MRSALALAAMLAAAALLAGCVLLPAAPRAVATTPPTPSPLVQRVTDATPTPETTPTPAATPPSDAPAAPSPAPTASAPATSAPTAPPPAPTPPPTVTLPRTYAPIYGVVSTPPKHGLVAFAAGADAGPDALSRQVPAYVISPDGASVAITVSGVPGGALQIDSLFRIVNTDGSPHEVSLSMPVAPAPGVDALRLTLVDPASGLVVGSADALAGNVASFPLAPGGAVVGALEYRVAEGSSPTLTAPLTLDVFSG